MFKQHVAEIGCNFSLFPILITTIKKFYCCRTLDTEKTQHKHAKYSDTPSITNHATLSITTLYVYAECSMSLCWVSFCWMSWHRPLVRKKKLRIQFPQDITEHKGDWLTLDVIKLFKANVHWQSLQAKMLGTVTDYVLALATLAGATQVGSFLLQSFGQGK